MSKNNCLWEDVVEKLVQYIETADLQPGDRFLSADEISERYGVSNITSRRVLTELAKLELIEKSRGRGCLIKNRQSINTIFILSEDERWLHFPAQSYVYSELYKGALEECNKLNINLKVISYHFFDDYSTDSKLNVLMLQNFPSYMPELAEMLQTNPNINCACCHSLTPLEGISTVRSDLGKGAYDMVSYMIKKGHKCIAFLGGGNPQWSTSRFDGYYSALKDNGLCIDTNLIKNVELTDESHTKAMTELLALQDAPTAVFTVADVNALRVVKYCKKNNISIPGDLAVSGFDDMPEASISTPPLTTVDAQLAEEGRLAVRLLVDNLPKDGSKDIVVEPKLVLRSSI